MFDVPALACPLIPLPYLMSARRGSLWELL